MRHAAVALGLMLASHAFGAGTIEGFTVSPYLTGNNPTGIRFTGPDEGFFIEQGGTVKRFANGSVTTALTLDVASGGERGLLGIAIDPDFATNRHVYLCYTEGSGSTWTGNRLKGFVWNGTTLTESPVVTSRTFGTAADGLAQGPNHNGGPLVFGPPGSGANAGKLFGVTGDLNRRGIEQNARSATTSVFTGGVYRLNPDGSVPDDNPFASHADAGVRPWYAYGVRNSFGLAFDPATGNVWNTENGPDAYDEINLLASRTNSGWTAIMGPDARSPGNAPDDLVELPGSTYRDPKFSIEDPIGITALEFLYDAWGGLDGFRDALIFGDVNTGNLWLLRLNAARDGFVLSGDLADGVLDVGDTLVPFGTGSQVITDLQVNPYDGRLYIVELGGTISRVAPVPEPHTWALALAGLAAVGWRLRLRAGTKR